MERALTFAKSFFTGHRAQENTSIYRLRGANIKVKSGMYWWARFSRWRYSFHSKQNHTPQKSELTKSLQNALTLSPMTVLHNTLTPVCTLVEVINKIRRPWKKQIIIMWGQYNGKNNRKWVKSANPRGWVVRERWIATSSGRVCEAW